MEMDEAARLRFRRRVDVCFTQDQFVWIDESAVVGCGVALAACQPLGLESNLSRLTCQLATCAQCQLLPKVQRVLQDSRTTNRRYGWSLRGQRTTTKTIQVRGRRFTTLPVMSSAGLLSWFTMEGAASAAHMEAFADVSLVNICALVMVLLHLQRARLACVSPRLDRVFLACRCLI